MKRISLISLSLGVLLLPFIALWSQGYVFGPNVRVSDYPSGGAQCYTPSTGMRGIAVRSDTVYCVWRDTRTGESGVWFAKSINDGQSFLPNVQVNDGLPNAYLPTIAVGNDGTIYVAWEDRRPGYGYVGEQIYFSKSTDGGLTFTPDVLVNDTAGGLKNETHKKPSMAVDSTGNIYIAFYDSRLGNAEPRYDIYFSRSTDGGATFSQDVLVNDTLPGDSMWTRIPSVAVSDDGIIYVSWSNDYKWIYVSKSIDGGMSFSSDVLVNDTITESWQNSMDIDSRGYVHIAWYDHRDNNYNIYYSRSTDTGLTFSPNIRVNDSIQEPPYQGSPSLCVDDTGIVYAVWEDGSAVTPDIYFTLSTDISNQVFVQPNVRVNDISDDSARFNPSIAVGDSGKVYVMWGDSRFHNFLFDVYFARGLYESGVVEDPADKAIDDYFRISVFPNPFSDKVTIEVLKGKNIRQSAARVYDISGRLIQCLEGNSDYSQTVRFQWDGRNTEGKRVPSGFYFITVHANSETATKRIICIP